MSSYEGDAFAWARETPPNAPSPEVVIREEGVEKVWVFRRREDDPEEFELVREDGTTKSTATHWDDVLLDNIAKRDDEITHLRKQSRLCEIDCANAEAENDRLRAILHNKVGPESY